MAVFNLHKTNTIVSRALALLTIVSYCFIHYDDTVWDLPVIIWTALRLTAGTWLEKVFSFCGLLSFLYISSLCFSSKFNFKITLTSLGILSAMVAQEGVFLLSGKPIELQTTTGLWFFVPSGICLLNALLLLYNMIKLPAERVEK
ncbi:hypothetical protein [Larkinella soli]|uniref:hypothetical protein n=1 Tax=Larkinella soli TaxID=1770527 RepID=UPI000FFBC9B0|nr:hypothetical protein [Larkinella soli]